MSFTRTRVCCEASAGHGPRRWMPRRRGPEFQGRWHPQRHAAGLDVSLRRLPEPRPAFGSSPGRLPTGPRREPALRPGQRIGPLASREGGWLSRPESRVQAEAHLQRARGRAGCGCPTSVTLRRREHSVSVSSPKCISHCLLTGNIYFFPEGEDTQIFIFLLKTPFQGGEAAPSGAPGWTAGRLSACWAALSRNAARTAKQNGVRGPSSRSWVQAPGWGQGGRGGAGPWLPGGPLRGTAWSGPDVGPRGPGGPV